MDAPLRRKLLSIVVLIALACAVPIAMGFRANARLTDAQEDTRAFARDLDLLDALRASVRESTSAVQTYLVLGSTDSQKIDDYRAAARPIPDQIAALNDDLPSELAPSAQDLTAATDALLAELDALVDGTTPRAPDAGGTVTFDVDSTETLAVVGGISRALGAEAVIDEASEALGRSLDAGLADSRADVDVLQQRLVWATLASVVAGIQATVVVTYVVTGGIVRRIARLSENADRFLRGERLLPTMASADEIGRLSDRVLFAGKLLDARREEAVAATRAKDQFLSRVSHELKAPLTAMIDHGRSLQHGADLSPENREDAQRIVRAGRQLHDLIQEMLDIKAIEAGQLALSIEPVPVHDVTEDAISLVRPTAANRSITLSADCPDDAVVSADRRRLREVLLNLLSNAVKYNREAGSVDVTATPLDQVVRICVTDDGPGISPADQQLLFRPFERLAAADTEVEGSGIGLSLTKHVVEAMDGTIGVTSRPGHGATFWFDLPAAERVPGADRDGHVGRRGATRG
jgi:signal transduction histidine kinase